MQPHTSHSPLTPLHRLFADARRRQATDGDLLQAFTQHGEEDAYSELMRRYGSMVLHLALHLLHHRQDAEDVFQATFLTLARKASSLRQQSSVAAWLHRVAWRLAVRSRAASKRTIHPLSLSLPAGQNDPADEISLREALGLLHEELAALPERLRSPLLLCYLQGRTRDEAARRLGWSLGTLKRRLEQGCKLLHARLSRRGVTLPAVLLASLLALTEVSAELAHSTLRLATPALAGAASLPASVAALLVEASWSVRVKIMWGLVLTLGVCTGAWIHQAQSSAPAEPHLEARTPTETVKSLDEAAWKRLDAPSDPLPEGALARIGSTRFRHSEKVWCVAFSPDGKTVASGGCDEVVRFWDVKSGRQLGVSSRYCFGIGSLAYSPDGAVLAVRDWGSAAGISLVDTATAEERRFVKFPKYPEGNSGGEAVAFTPDGKLLASVNPVGEVCLFDFASGKQTAVLGKHDHSHVPVLTFSPEGRMLASSAHDATIRLWDVAQRKALFVLRSEDTTAFPIVFTKDGKWLISGGGTQETPNKWDSPWGNPAIRVWDTATGKQLQVFREPDVRGTVASLALAPDGRTLAVSCGDKLRLWDVTTGKVLRTMSRSHRYRWAILSLCFSPDGKILAGGLGNIVGLWEAASGRLLNLDERESASAIHSVALTGDGRLFADGDEDGWISLRDFRSRRLIRRFQGHDSGVRQVAFSPDDKTMASISTYGRLRAWDVASGRQRFQFPIDTPKNSRPTNLAYSPDGTLLAYAYFSDRQQGGPRGIRLLDATTGMERQNLPIGDAILGWFDGFSFSSDGRHLVGTVDREIHGWRREADRFVKKGLLSKDSFACSVAYTHQGFLSVERFTGKGLSFRDYETGRLLIEPAGFPLLGSLKPPLGSTLTFSRDGRYLASGPAFTRGGDPKTPRDTLLRVFEMTTGQEVLRWQLPPHTGCNSLTFAPDGRTLVAAMTDTTVLLWDAWPLEKKLAMNAPALWANLAGNDAKKAFRSMGRLIAAPEDALALLHSRLKPVENVDPKRIAQWIADLDADSFVVRDKATEELHKLGELAEPALSKALASRPPLETRRRLQNLLDEIHQQQWRPSMEKLRQIRAVEVLERIGTAETKKLLEMLAKGAEGARQTREAHAALQRLQSVRSIESQEGKP